MKLKIEGTAPGITPKMLKLEMKNMIRDMMNVMMILTEIMMSEKIPTLMKEKETQEIQIQGRERISILIAETENNTILGRT